MILKINVKSRVLPFGIAAIALVLCVAAYLSWDSDLGSSSQPGERNRMTPTTGEDSSQSQAIRKQSIQQMIDSGQFDPPPGNTERLNSAVSPFTRTAPAESQRTSPRADSLRQDQQGQVWIGGTIPAGGASDKIAAAVSRQDSPSVSATAQAQSAAPPQPQTQSGVPHFETPPGIGSPTGG